MPRLEIGGENGWHPEEIGVFGRVFTTRRVSRSVNKRIQELDERMRLAPDDDASFDALAELMDLLLVPTGGQKKTAGQVLREMWESDKLFLDQINDFAFQVREAASSPPTQPAS